MFTDHTMPNKSRQGDLRGPELSSSTCMPSAPNTGRYTRISSGRAMLPMQHAVITSRDWTRLEPSIIDYQRTSRNLGHHQPSADRNAMETHCSVLIPLISGYQAILGTQVAAEPELALDLSVGWFALTRSGNVATFDNDVWGFPAVASHGMVLCGECQTDG